ncbi:hypothetical protein D9M68_861990 [compost metagenome]
MHDAEYLLNIRPDEEFFTNQADLLVLLTSEVEVFTSENWGERLKCFDFLKRRSDISAERFLEAIRQCSDKFSGQSRFRTAIARRINNTAISLNSSAFSAPAAYDFVLESWVENHALFSEVHTEEIESLLDFLDLEQSFTVFASEHPILDRTT